MDRDTILRAVKIAHTAIWAFFVLAIGAIWVFALRGDLTKAFCAIGIVLIEVVVLGFNQGRCPLGVVVERYTDDRAANFDIYLPPWLAGRTKPIFGPLFGGGVVLTAIRWATAAS
jgi:hypothetical protein